jgi:hypothetical protein
MLLSFQSSVSGILVTIRWSRERKAAKLLAKSRTYAACGSRDNQHLYRFDLNRLGITFNPTKNPPIEKNPNTP